MKTKRLKIPLYHGSIIICLADDLEEVSKKYRMESFYMYDGVSFRDHVGEYTQYVMAFNKDVSSKTIAHEALHTVSKIFEDRKIWCDVTNDEPQCYLLGWIVGECHKFIKPSDKNL